jgi:hypothetical protein
MHRSQYNKHRLRNASKPALEEVEDGLDTAQALVKLYGSTYQQFVDFLIAERDRAIGREVEKIRGTEPVPPTVAGLERSLGQAARIIERHGAKYLPVFLLIETALAEARNKRDAMARVRAVTSKRPVL